jgi:TolB protein
MSAILIPSVDAARGERIVFSVSIRSRTLGLASIRPNGDERRPITDERDSFPQFSPDGRMIAFTRESGSALDLFVATASGGSARSLIRQRSTFDPFCEGFDWAPDSTKLVVVGENGSRNDCDLFIVGLDGSVTPLLEGEGFQAAPRWSPAGNEIAFHAEDPAEETSDIYTLPAEGGDPVRVTTDPEEDIGPAWSPDGQRLAFSTDRHDCCGTEFGATNFELYAIDRDGTDELRLTTNEDLNDLGPVWSPFGAWIAYSTDAICTEPPGCGAAEDIWKVRSDGSETVRMTRSQHAAESNPVWSPNGRWLVYVRRRGGRDDLAKVSANGARNVRLTRTRRIHEVSPDWH